MTTLEFYKQVMALINAVDDGIIDITDADYKALAVNFINIRQSALAKYGDLYKEHNITKTKFFPLYSTYKLLEHSDEDIIITAEQKANSYYFEVNGTGTVYIEESQDNVNWQEIEHIDFVTTSSTAYKDNITYTSGYNYMRLRFTGEYFYTITNIALYKEKFVTVPEYRPYVKYEMPLDFQSIDQIIEETADGNYINSSSYKWENGKNLYINNQFNGNIRIIYKPTPTKVTAIDSENLIQISDTVANTALAYGVASDILVNEDIGIANYFEQKYQECLFEAKRPKKATFQEINDVYGGI